MPHSHAIRTPPSWPSILNEQLRMLLLSKWRLLASGTGGTAIFLVLTWRSFDLAGGIPRSEMFEFLPAFTPALALVALLLAVDNWKEEEPRRRGYHWSMPLPRWQHALLRIVAGWVIMIAWSAAMLSILTTYAIAMGATEMVLGIPPAHWLLPMASVSLGHLLGSALAIGTEYPLRWILGFTVVELGFILFPRTSVLWPLVEWISGILTSLTYAAGGLWLRDATAVLNSWPLAYLFWSSLGALSLFVALTRHRDL